MRLAVVPARGGSKRIPRKNIKYFCGKPMLARSIEAALQSNCFDHIVVSTDDYEIAQVARQCGAHVPYMRPAALSDDHTDTTSVIVHAIEWFTAQGNPPELVCCLYPTAPFVHSEDIRTGLKVLIDSGAEYAFSVTSYQFPIQRAIRINTDNRVEMLNSEYFTTRSQDLTEAYHDAGQFYWGKASAWQQRKVLFSPAAAPVMIPRHRVQDIDTPEDWLRAELMFKAMQAEQSMK